jgi:hypothetical protein
LTSQGELFTHGDRTGYFFVLLYPWCSYLRNSWLSCPNLQHQAGTLPCQQRLQKAGRYWQGRAAAVLATAANNTIWSEHPRLLLRLFMLLLTLRCAGLLH